MKNYEEEMKNYEYIKLIKNIMEEIKNDDQNAKENIYTLLDNFRKKKIKYNSTNKEYKKDKCKEGEEKYELCEEIYEIKNETEKGEITVIDPISTMDSGEINVTVNETPIKFKTLEHIGDLVSKIRNIYGYDACKMEIVIKDEKSIIITKTEIPDRYNSDIDVKVENEISKSTDKIESINLLDYFNLPYENEINLADKKSHFYYEYYEDFNKVIERIINGGIDLGQIEKNLDQN